MIHSRFQIDSFPDELFVDVDLSRTDLNEMNLETVLLTIFRSDFSNRSVEK